MMESPPTWSRQHRHSILTSTPFANDWSDDYDVDEVVVQYTLTPWHSICEQSVVVVEYTELTPPASVSLSSSSPWSW